MFNNPIAFAAVAIIAVGFVIYEFLLKEEKPHGGRGGRGGPGGRGPPSSPPSPPPTPKKPPTPRKKPPEEKPHGARGGRGGGGPPSSPPPSSPPPEQPPTSPKNPPSPPNSESPSPESPSPTPGTGSASSPPTESINAQNSTNNKAVSKDSENCVVRRRNVCSKKTNSNTVTANERDSKEKTSSDSPRDGGQQNQLSTTFNDNIDVKNYKMNDVDKLIEEVKSINIDPEEQGSLDDNITDSDSDNDMFETPVAGLTTIGASGASGSQLQEDEEEMTYKRNVRDKLKSDVENMYKKVDCKEERRPGSMRRNEVASTSSGRSLGLTASGRFVTAKENAGHDINPKVCRACEEGEENDCKAVAYPCGHCNLCSECAERLFRLYKKCNICLSDIDGYQY